MSSPCKHLAFVAIDGDRVGEAVENALASLDLERASRFSQEVERYFTDLRSAFERRGAAVHICAGDSLLASLARSRLDVGWLRELPSGPCTISIGVGGDPRSSMMALHMAKALGRDQMFSLLDSDTAEDCP